MSNKINHNLIINGMHCAACSSAVERAVKKLDNVQDVSVNLLTKKAVVVGNAKLNIAHVKQAIIKAGFEVIDANVNIQQLNQSNKYTVISALFFATILMYIGMAFVHAWPLPNIFSKNTQDYQFYASIQLPLSIIVMIICNKFYVNGFKNLVLLSPNMDSLISIGTMSAFLYSCYNLYIGITKNDFLILQDLYFTSVGVILGLVTLGKYIEDKGKRGASSALQKLSQLVPFKAIVLQNNNQVEIDTANLQIGDVVLVKPGSVVPVDGILLSDNALLNESLLTGESLPVEKNKNDEVIAGSFNSSNAFTFSVTKLQHNTFIAKLIQLVETAQLQKPNIVKLADNITKIFVPTVIAIATLSFIIWMLVGAELGFALKIFVAILVIACPCALGLATPSAIMVATSVAASKGVVIKGGLVLEALSKINVIALDKTGTITKGMPTVSSIITANNCSANLLIEITASLESLSNHPIAHAIVEYAKANNIAYNNATNFVNYSGKGLTATYNNKTAIIGKKLIIENNIPIPSNLLNTQQELTKQGKIVVFVAYNNSVIGLISIADDIKDSSVTAFKGFNLLNLKTVMLTGDNYNTANYIASKVGVKSFIANMLPADKTQAIENYQTNGQSVAMVGDGINDAAALSKANVGIAIGSGADIAIESADVVLVNNNLLDVFYLVNLSKLTFKTIKQNLLWAFLYNIIGIPIAAGALYYFTEWTLSPIFASFAMSASSISVLLNAFKLKYYLS